MPRRFDICALAELPSGARKIVSVDGRSIGLFNVDGALYAIKNRCPHQGAPLCRGTLSGTFRPGAPGEYAYVLDGRVLRCPWHFWEFDITSGRVLFRPDSARVKTYDVAAEPRLDRYPVAVEDARVVIYL